MMRITAQNQINIKPQLADFLTTLEVGDTVRGRIMEIFGESISLRTSTGEILTAALAGDAELRTGQSIELVISKMTAEGIFAELTQDEPKQAKATEDTKLLQVLKQMQLKPEETNLQAAKKLLKYNMPITKENIQLLQNTQKSIESLTPGDATKALSLMQSEVDINRTEFVKLAKHAAIFEQQSTDILNPLKADISAAEEIAHHSPPKAMVQNKEALQTNADPSTKKTDQNLTERPQFDGKITTDTVKQLLLQSDMEELQQSAPKLEKLIDTVLKLFEAASKATPEHSAYLISKDIKVTPAAVKLLIEPGSMEAKLGTQLEGLEKLVLALEKNGVDVRDIKEAVQKLFLQPEVLQDKEQVQETLKEIIRNAGKTEALINEHGFEDQLDRSVLSDIKNNVDFIKNINTTMNYIQIPLIINENKTTAELYVFSGKKRGKSINPENASIVIALDLQALGHIESLISVYKRSVNVTFKVEKDQFKRLILDSAEALKISLEARGYALNPIQVIDMTERFSLLQLEEMISQTPGNMHFDIKV